ncbi:MAG: putative phage tail protein [Acutalibacteraceae bacterium]|nr:putative phage tail protein [Acutalibacteraceae bacterium]
MDLLENMLKHLKPLMIYNLNDNTVVYKELEVYANAFDEVIKKADNLFKESMVTTAEAYGLDMQEELWGLPRTELTVEQRRESIKNRYNIKYSDSTLKSMQHFLMSVGVQGQITEVPSKNRVYVYVENGSQFPLGVRKYINAQAESFFPAHIDVFLDYRVATWDTLDAHGTMFDTYDSFNFTWDRAEHFE